MRVTEDKISSCPLCNHGKLQYVEASYLVTLEKAEDVFNPGVIR